jgi:hypothetical protein
VRTAIVERERKGKIERRVNKKGRGRGKIDIFAHVGWEEVVAGSSVFHVVKW